MIVSADLDGYLNFYAIYPSSYKGQMLARVNYINQYEQIKGYGGKIREEVAFPMRALDFNPANNILYTGDDAGYLQKWDLTVLLQKLKAYEQASKYKQEIERKASIENVSFQKMAATMQSQGSEEGNTFLTGLMAGDGKEEMTFSNDDVKPDIPWRAHKDTISWVSYIDDLDIIASCSFDKNVYLWDVSGPHKEQVGSLELGMKAVPPGVQPDSE